MLWKVFSIVFIFLVIAATPVQAGAESIRVGDMSDELVCQCGCGMILTNCSHSECGSSEAMTAFINDELDKDVSGPAIIRTFVNRYGEQVLSSPPKKGFNLIAWILPFAVIIIGGVIIYIALKRWVVQGNLPTDAADDDYERIFTEYDEQLSKELRDFSGSGFR